MPALSSPQIVHVRNVSHHRTVMRPPHAADLRRHGRLKGGEQIAALKGKPDKSRGTYNRRANKQ